MTPGVMFPKPYADAVQRSRVPIGFVLIAAFMWLARPVPGSLLLGVPIAAAGMLLRAWAAGHLAKNERLAVSGPYARVRNPLYLGSLVAAVGMIIAARSLTMAVLLTGAFVLVYLPAIELEEQHLRSLFPAYDAYADRVPMLLPAHGRSIPSEHRFQWKLFWRNREYKALLGFLAGLAALLWKLHRGA